MGILPLAYDRPLRFTSGACVEKNIHRNTPGNLKGMILAAEEEASLREQAGSEVFLVKMPKAMKIEVQHEEEKPFTYELPAESVIGSRDPKGHSKVKRRGFRITLDFAGTAHAYCADLLEWHAKPTMDAPRSNHQVNGPLDEGLLADAAHTIQRSSVK